MICNEKGVLPSSQYFFFAPTDMFKGYYPYIINCGHFYCQKGYRVAREGNHAPLLLYVIAGKFYLDYEENSYAAAKSDIILIDGDKPHAYYVNDACEFIYMHYYGGNSLDITRHLLAQNASPVFRLKNHRRIFQTASSLLAKLYFNQDVGDTDLSCTIYECLCLMQTFNTSLSEDAAANPPMVEKAIKFIRENVRENITLDDVANHVGLSAYYFSHLFKRETGCTPIEYAAQCKINLAKTMLKTTEQTISSISDYLGYSSSASFINAFSRRTGLSPLKFRNNADWQS